MNYELLIIPSAYILDLIFGDPVWHWHPVRLIGRLIEKLEKKLNTEKRNKIFSGAVLVILVVGLTALCVYLTLVLARAIHPVFYYVISVVFVYFSFSIKSLAVEADKVRKSLGEGDMEKARKDLSMIVGRDTGKLNEPEIIRATVETVAESAMDGIVAPMFYAFLGGPVLVWVYKAVNTLDSMVGHKNERFIEFGRLSALLDGVMNIIPAKITCLLISISSFCYGKNWLGSLRQGLKYIFQGPGVNSESTEAVMAGGLNIRLGGVNFYNSAPVHKPFIGEGGQPLIVNHIKESIHIAYISSALMLISGVLFCLLQGSAFAEEEYPQRIISLGPAITEELYLLGADDRLVGCTTYCQRPDEAKNKEKIGAVVDVNLEKIAAFRPDVVLMTPLTDSRVKEKLKNLGIKVVEFPAAKDFSEVCSSFLELGRIVGKKREAEKITDEARNRINFMALKLRGLAKPRVFVQVGAKPLVTVAEDSFANDFIELSGGINIAKGIRYARYSREKVVESDPDVILIVTMGINGEKEKKTWQDCKALKAVKNNRIYILDPYLLCSPTPVSFVEIVEKIAGLLHGN